MNTRIDNKRMILIGSTGRNIGKTTLSCNLIEKFKETHRVYALKVTTIADEKVICPRGGEGCGTCTSLQGDFDIREELVCGENKDTHRLKQAGAQRVFWIRAYRETLLEAYKKFEELYSSYDFLITESNSLRQVVNPKLFIMIDNKPKGSGKKTALAVMDKADFIIPSFEGALPRELQKKIDSLK